MAKRNGPVTDSADTETAPENEGAKKGRTTNENRSPEAQQKLDLVREAKVILRNLARETVDKALQAAIFLVVGSGTRAVRGSVQSKNTVILAAIVEAGKEGISEMDIFRQFKIGRPEMSNKCRIFVKTDKPADRVWIAFDESAEVYRVMGTGETKPEGWKGFVPADEKQL